MVKIKHKGLLVIGLNDKELKLLKSKLPVMIALDDIGLPGQGVVVVHNHTNELLLNQAKDIAGRLVKVDTQAATGLVLPEDMKGN